ncbi:MAG: sugar transferase [Bacteroidetes bacterium]|nr:sugar transferase [Bacteroidota bacterium]
MNINKLTNSRTSQIFLQWIADTIAIWLGFAAQLYLRFFSNLFNVPTVPTIADYVSGSILMSVFWYLIFYLSGMYRNWHIRSPFNEFFSIIRTSFIGCFIIALLIFADNTADFRMLFLIYFIIMTCSFTIFRFIARRIQIKLRIKRIIKIPILLIGDKESVVDFYNRSKKNVSWGYSVCSIVSIKDNKEEFVNYLKENNIDENIYCGDAKVFDQIIDKYKKTIEEIVFSASKTDSELLFNLADVCIENGIRVNIEPNLYDHFTGQSRTQNIYGIPLIEVNTKLLRPWEIAIKRLFDIVFSILVIVVGMPIWLLVALIIKLESEGSVFYSQPRVGLNNKIFTIYKFRSMAQAKCTDPENQQWTAIGDPRVTKFGKIIRKTHIDEIPQFYNVLIGDMSVVGPRPEQPKFVEEFAKELHYYKRRHLVRPGITGWWQVKYKPHTLSIDEIKSRTKDDFYYIENISLQLDFEIIIRTVWCVISGHGQS